MLRTLIVGCGKIADLHVQAIRRIPGCEIAGACDREPLMARQLTERFSIAGCFSSFEQALQLTLPDIVHITVPPQDHYNLAQLALKSGAHVYLEKPFTITAAEATSLIQTATSCSRSITAGHNYQFTPEMCEMRRLVADGFLGGKPVHVESHFPYDLSDASYVSPLLGSRNHWVRQLPGQLLHNLVSHGIAKLAEFLDDEIVEVIARAYESPRMLALGGEGIFDELRVMIRDKTGTTAFFCFSSQFKPGLNQLRLFGPANSLIVDQGCGSVIRMSRRNYKSYLTYFVPPLQMAREHFRNARCNVGKFLTRKLYHDFGMTDLIGRFYTSIREAQPPPIPYREILLTARIMDEVFSQTGSPLRNEVHARYAHCDV